MYPDNSTCQDHLPMKSSLRTRQVVPLCRLTASVAENARRFPLWLIRLILLLSGWWFQTFFIFPNSLDDDPV